MEEFEKASCIRHFHVYQDKWTPILGERFVCNNEPGNPRDRYAVVVCKAGDEIVGHLPTNISTMCLVFIRRSVLHSFRETAIFKGSSTGWDGKNLLENFRDWRLIHKNHESFPPRMICIIRSGICHLATFLFIGSQ